MPKSHGSADRYYIEQAAARNLTITFGKLESWRRNPPLLEANPRVYPGDGGSSTPMPDAASLNYGMWLAEHSKQGIRRQDLALRAFHEGHPVPERTVRAAFLDVIDQIFDRIDAIPDDGRDAGDRAATYLEARQGSGEHAAVLPARVREIDRRLADRGIGYTSPELQAMDDGPDWGDEPPTHETFSHFAITVMLGGGAEADPGMLASMARMLMPAGTASPPASWLTYDPRMVCDPERGLVVPEADDFVLLPAGRMSDLLRELVHTTPVELLRRALGAAREQEFWARQLTEQVEEAVATGVLPLEPLLQWLMGGVLGTSRTFLRAELSTQRRAWTDLPSSALQLLWMRRSIRGLIEALPDGQWWLLDNPSVLPAFLTRFLHIEPQLLVPPGDAVESTAEGYHQPR